MLHTKAGASNAAAQNCGSQKTPHHHSGRERRHTRTVLSLLAVTMRRPSGEKTAEESFFVWPVKDVFDLPRGPVPPKRERRREQQHEDQQRPQRIAQAKAAPLGRGIRSQIGRSVWHDVYIVNDAQVGVKIAGGVAVVLEAGSGSFSAPASAGIISGCTGSPGRLPILLSASAAIDSFPKSGFGQG